MWLERNYKLSREIFAFFSFICFYRKDAFADIGGISETGNTIHHVDVVFNSREFQNKKNFFSNNEPFAKEKHSLVRSHFVDGFIPKRHNFESRVSNERISSLHFSSVLTTDGHIRGGPIYDATNGLLPP